MCEGGVHSFERGKLKNVTTPTRDSKKMHTSDISRVGFLKKIFSVQVPSPSPHQMTGWASRTRSSRVRKIPPPLPS